MSYILDALKESDQQRRDADPQSAAGETLPGPVPLRPARRYGILLWLLLLVLAGAAIAWTFYTPAVVTEAGRVSQANPVPVPEEEPERLGAQALSGVKLVLDGPARGAGSDSDSSEPPSAVSAARAATNAGPTDSGAPRSRAGAAQVRSSAPAAAAAASPPDPYAGLPYLRQLPVSIQRELPALSVSVHIYSEQPAGRMVKLNDRMMREGQRIAPGLQLEAIIPKGVVLSYKEYRFKLPTL